MSFEIVDDLQDENSLDISDKLSKAQKANWSPERRAKYSERMRKLWEQRRADGTASPSVETRKKIGDACRGKKNPKIAESRRRNGTNKPSEESNQKRREKMRAWWASHPEAHVSMTERLQGHKYNSGRKQTPEQIQKRMSKMDYEAIGRHERETKNDPIKGPRIYAQWLATITASGGLLKNNTPEAREKAKKTCLERYGVENPLQNPDVLSKMFETKIKRFGRADGPVKNTLIEIAVEAWLVSKGLKYESQVHRKSVSIDFFLPDQNLCIFVDGCYWHGHVTFEHQFWGTERQMHQKEKDMLNTAKLTREGFRVVRIWECAVKAADFSLLEHTCLSLSV